MPEALDSDVPTDHDERLSHDQRLARLEVLGAWRDAQEWLKITDEMRKSEEGAQSLGTPLPPEVIALAMLAARRISSRSTDPRRAFGTLPDVDAMTELSGASERALNSTRDRLDKTRAALLALREDIRARLTRPAGASLGPLEMLERLDLIYSL